MSKLKITLDVARWEFTRFYKIKNELIAVALMVGVAAIAFVAMFFSMQMDPKKPEIVLVNEDVLNIDSTIYDNFTVHHAGYTDIDEWKIKVETGDVAGLIIIETVDKGEIYTSSKRPWMRQLERLLTGYRHQSVVSLSAIPPETIEYLLQPFTLDAVYHDEQTMKERGTERAFAIGFIVLMIVAILIGFGYQFTAITGEKQQRITELIVSAISPQTWIDGKILGITAISLVTIIFYGTIALAISLPFAQYFGPGIFEWIAHMSVWKFLAFLLLSMLGLLLWNSFFTAVAATINDPSTSMRGVFMMLPVLSVVFAPGAIRHPDSTFIAFLGIFPGTSSTMLPARMVLTNVQVWEFFLAVLLLIGAIWLFRKTAAKIFSFGMLTYGKEPGLSEMWRWVKES